MTSHRFQKTYARGSERSSPTQNAERRRPFDEEGRVAGRRALAGRGRVKDGKGNPRWRWRSSTWAEGFGVASGSAHPLSMTRWNTAATTAWAVGPRNTSP